MKRAIATIKENVMRALAPGLVGLLLSLAVGGVAFGQTSAAGGPTPSPAGAAVYFIDLKDGATITPKTTLHFGLRGMGIAPAGSDKANSGHHHLLIDTDLPPLNEPIPSDFNHMHFGAGQTEVDLELSPGPHTLQLLLGDKNHIPHSPPVISELVHVTVADEAAAPAPTAQATPVAPPANTSERHTSPPGAKVYIDSPANGAAVPLTFNVRFGLINMGVAPAGVEKANSGHHHLLIDTELPPLDEPIPSDANHMHFGAGQTEATITLTPGKHTLQLLLGDANHVPHIPAVYSQPIVVFAGEAAPRNTCGRGETIGSNGSCAPQAARKPALAPRQRTVRTPRPGGPSRRVPSDLSEEPSPAPARAAPAASGQEFRDLRYCAPGTHSISFPGASGYRCMPNQ
jgi:hypothetical protein